MTVLNMTSHSHVKLRIFNKLKAYVLWSTTQMQIHFTFIRRLQKKQQQQQNIE